MAMSSGGQTVLRDAAFPALKRAAIGLTGMAYWADKEDALAELLAGLLADRHLPPSLFARRLAAESGRGPETDALVSRVTVGETSFFRYPEQFRALETVVLPERLHANHGHRTLSLWSAGCSVGAEVYSLAILLARSFAVALADWRVHLLGTDISPAALESARRGQYSEWVVRDVPAAMRRDCFVRVGGEWRVRDDYRSRVVFCRHNLVTDGPPHSLHGGFDVVLCRNVLMYFDPPSRVRAIAGLRRAMAPGGWLLVGHAETGLDFGAGFAPVSVEGWTLFRRHDGRRQPQAPAREPRVPVPMDTVPPGAVQARQLLDRGQFAQAAAACRSWSDRQPLEAEAHYHLGLALEALSAGQAVEAFRRAVFLAPGFALAHFHLLRLLQRRGDTALAGHHRAMLRAVLAGQPPETPLRLGGGMTAGELARLVDRLGGAL